MKKEKREEMDITAMYFNSIKDIKVLDSEEEKELIIKAQQGDIKARNKIVNANLKFVVKSVKKYSSANVPILDLIEEGNMGLMEAIKHFDVESGNKFTTYAIWWINQSIIKYFQDKSRLIRIPVNKSNDLIRINKMIDKYNDKNEAVDFDEIAGELGIDRSAVVNLINIACPVVSLDKSLDADDDSGSGKASVHDVIPSDLPSAEDELEAEDERRRIESVIDTLPEREREVIKMRYGFNNFGEMCLEDIGQVFNLTKERIRQLEIEALAMLKEKLAM